MEKEYLCVLTVLNKYKDEEKPTIETSYQYHTGIDDPKDLILYKKLSHKHGNITNVDYKLWKGPKYGDRLGLDMGKQIGESYAIIWHYAYRDEIDVYELYEIED